MLELFIFSFLIILLFSLALFFKARADEKRESSCGGTGVERGCGGVCTCSRKKI